MYIVTGGAGMIGSAIIWALNGVGITDILVVDNLACTDKWKNLVGLQYSDYMHRDEFIRKVRANELGIMVNAVIHMGACSDTTRSDADFLMSNNFHYTRDLFLYCLSRGFRFVNASSAATYGGGEHGFYDDMEHTKQLRPLNMYGYSKHLFDMWCYRNQHLDEIASLKFFNVYGPNEYHKGDMRSVACKAVGQIKEKGFLQLFASDNSAYAHGGQLRDFIYVKDCARLVLWFLENKQVNGIFNLGTGKARTWNDVAKAVFTAMDKPVQVKYIPLPQHLAGKYQYFTQADMSWLSHHNCPITLTSLEDGIKEYVQDYLLADNPYLSSLSENSDNG